MNGDDVEYSPLCGYVTGDGVSVRVVICRQKGSNEGWSLEVINADGSATTWSDCFPTDLDAYQAFFGTMQEEGIRSFVA